MVTVNVFFAYQFAKAQISKISRERAYTDALNAVNAELKETGASFLLRWEYWNIQSGEGLTDAIFSQMDRSDLYVFDISDSNSNVFIELGYSISQVRFSGKKLIVFVHSEIERKTLPSDISGMFVHSLNECELRMVLASELISKASLIIPITRLVRDFWNRDCLDLDIICPVLPEDRRSRHAHYLEANYLKYLSFADLDTLFFLQEKTKDYFPSSRTANFRSDKYEDSRSTTSLVIGGPAWNEIARNIQHSLPLKFTDGGDGHDDPVTEFVNGEFVFHRPIENNSQIESDISYLARLDMRDGSYTFLISGCRTYGVLGAAKAFFESSVAPANIQLIYNLCQERDFVIAFTTKVIANRAIPSKLDSTTIRSFYQRGKSGDFERVEI